MVEPEIESETNFEQPSEIDELAEQLEAEGFHPDEIEEMLFSDDTDIFYPRRHRRHRRHARRAYDTPRRHRRVHRVRRGGRRGGRKHRGGRRLRYFAQKTHRPKGALGKFRKYVLPGTFAASFYLSYSANAKARNLSIMDALKQDIQNWDINSVGNKIKTNPTPVLVTVGGIAAKKMIPGANRGMLGLAVDAAIGIAGGQLATQLVDEPAPLRTAARAAEVRTQPTQAVGYNPYA